MGVRKLLKKFRAAQLQGNKLISCEASYRLRVNMYNMGSRVLRAVTDVFSYGSRSTSHLLKLLITSQKMRKRLAPAVIPNKFYYSLRSLLDNISDVAIKQLAVSYNRDNAALQQYNRYPGMTVMNYPVDQMGAKSFVLQDHLIHHETHSRPVEAHLNPHELYHLRSRGHKSRTYICCHGCDQM